MAEVTRQGVVAGALVFVGAVAIGKIAIDNILRERAERFKPKGQPAAARAARESTMDGVVKFAGTIYSMYLLSEEMPQLLKEAQKALE